MRIIKLLIMGLPASGKTTFVKHVFERKEINEIKDYVPTYGVNVALYKYEGVESIKVSTFDCGGQTSFIDAYSTDEWVPRLFAEVSAFFFLVDSSSKKTLRDAGVLFRKYLDNVSRLSEDTVVHMLAAKWDKHAVTEDDLNKVFPDIKAEPISVLDDSARKVTQRILDDLISRKRKNELRVGLLDQSNSSSQGHRS